MKNRKYISRRLRHISKLGIFTRWVLIGTRVEYTKTCNTSARATDEYEIVTIIKAYNNRDGIGLVDVVFEDGRVKTLVYSEIKKNLETGRMQYCY